MSFIRTAHIWLVASVVLATLVFSLKTVAEDYPQTNKPPAYKMVDKPKDQTLLKTMKDSDLQQRQYMIEISRQLGVTCTHCHDLKDFKKSDKPAYKVGKSHIEVVKHLNEKYSGQMGPKVDCYMCHRGAAKPDYKEKLGTDH